jgi:hypothetical protein
VFGLAVLVPDVAVTCTPTDGLTVSVALADCPPPPPDCWLVPVIVVVPAACAVMLPLPSIVATLVLLELQVTGHDRALPHVLNTVAEADVVCVGVMVLLASATLMLPAGADPTLALWLAIVVV